ncbi:MAG: hypothetical protein LBI08_03735 [Methanomassiliicoccaceae archaeon]|nr:hypothetical protein [Methanomassiliicoccaceae archaeon]
MSEKELGLAEGARYSVTAEKDTVSEGIFKGYAMIGNESAIVLELPEGATRIIPVARIVHIDLLGAADRKKDGKRPEPYYG